MAGTLSPTRFHAAETVRLNGPCAISGSVRPLGFKHSMVLALGAAVAVGGRLTLRNCPDIIETDVLAKLIEGVGGSVERDGDALWVDASTIVNGHLDSVLSGRVHGAAYLLPGLLGRFGEASGRSDGGCPIGSGANGGRPTTHYASILDRFGATVHGGDGLLLFRAAGLTGCDIDLLDYTDEPIDRTGAHYSGATKTAILAAAGARGTSTLRNPYLKRDVLDLLDVLGALGVGVEIRDDVITVSAQPQRLGSHAERRLVPDLIEIVTWIVAAALASPGGLTIEDPDLDAALAGLDAELSLLRRVGVRIERHPTAVRVTAAEPLYPTDVNVTGSGIFSDSLPLIAVLLSRAGGPSVLHDGIWGQRYDYAHGLDAMGAGATIGAGDLHLSGRWRPMPDISYVQAGDLRSAAALVLGAMVREGQTVIAGAEHLHRGYEQLLPRLVALGADLSVTS